MSKFLVRGALMVAAAGLLAGCAHMGSQTNLAQVAAEAQLNNVTTSDGTTFKDYQALGHFKGTEIGLSVGIPLVAKLMEVYPKQNNTAQMVNIAKDAKAQGATDMVDVEPPKELYTGFPFFFVGIHIDSVSGTGIRAK